MAKVHWKRSDQITSCGLNLPEADSFAISTNGAEVTCERCKKALPAVTRTAWDLLNDEDVPPPVVVNSPPKRPRKPRVKKTKPPPLTPLEWEKMIQEEPVKDSGTCWEKGENVLSKPPPLTPANRFSEQQRIQARGRLWAFIIRLILFLLLSLGLVVLGVYLKKGI